MRKKLRDSSGLTMVEMLCATAILVLLCLMMNTGIHMAVVSYRMITAESEAQLLLSSLSDALADKLRYCVVYTNEDGTAVTDYSIGDVTMPDGMVLVGGSKLLPEGAYGIPDGFYKGDYQVTMGSAVPGAPASASLKDAYQKSTNSFAIKLTVEDVNLGIVKTTELTVRCLNPVRKEGTPP